MFSGLKHRTLAKYLNNKTWLGRSPNIGPEMRLNQQQESREGRPCSRIRPGAIQTLSDPLSSPNEPLSVCTAALPGHPGPVEAQGAGPVLRARPGRRLQRAPLLVGAARSQTPQEVLYDHFS